MASKKITIHGETGHMAVNVKTHGMRFADVQGDTEELRTQAWDMLVESFWQDADSIANIHGFGGVYSEGRSGGWCVPFNSSGRTYPSIDDAADRKRFLKFQKVIESLLADSPAYYEQILRELVAEEEAERNESERSVREFCQAM